MAYDNRFYLSETQIEYLKSSWQQSTKGFFGALNRIIVQNNIERSELANIIRVEESELHEYLKRRDMPTTACLRMMRLFDMELAVTRDGRPIAIL